MFKYPGIVITRDDKIAECLCATVTFICFCLTLIGEVGKGREREREGERGREREREGDRKSTRLNSSHVRTSRMPSSA